MMVDKDTYKSFGNPVLLICDADGEMKPIGKIVENSTRLESEEEPDCVPTKNCLSFSCEMPHLSKWVEENANLKPLREAQAMLDRLRDYHALWHKYYGFGFRKERRKIERNFNALAQRFALHCRLYGITIKRK